MRKTFLHVLWAVVVYAALSGCALLLTNVYASVVLPVYRWELSWIAPRYEVQKFEIDRSGLEPKFSLIVLGRRYVDVGGRPRRLTTVYQSSFQITSALQHVVLLFFVPLAWPGLTLKRRLSATIVAIPILCALEFADVPWSLVGAVDATRASSGNDPETIATIWEVLLATGGRLALSLAGGVLACGGGSFIESIRQAKQRARLPKKRRRATQSGPVGGRLKVKQLEQTKTSKLPRVGTRLKGTQTARNRE